MDEPIGEWCISPQVSRRALELSLLFTHSFRGAAHPPARCCPSPPWTTRGFFAHWPSALERRCRVKDRRRRYSSRADSSSISSQLQPLLRPPSARRLQRSHTPVQPALCARLRRRTHPCRRHRRDWCADRDDERRHCTRDLRRQSNSSSSRRSQPQPAPRLDLLSPLRLLDRTPTGTRRRERVARCRCLSGRRRPISGAAMNLDATTSRSRTRRSSSSSSSRLRIRRLTLVRT